jgi:hypothetical protein
VVEILSKCAQYHAMLAILFEYTAKRVIIHVLIDKLGGVRIAETSQALLHKVPLKLNGTCVHESKFFMNVSSNMADPIVVVTILS